MAETGILSEKQELFVQTLIRERSIRGAARASQTPERSAFRWMQEQKVQHRLIELRQQTTAVANAKLARGARKAIDALIALLDDTVAAGIRLHASKILLDAFLRMSDVDLEARLATLETQHALQKVQEQPSWDPHANNGNGR